MAVVQISFKDNANNEDSFKIYKGTATPLTSASTQIATIALSAGTWTATEFSSGSAPSLTLTSTGHNSDPATVGETFVLTYEEATANTYYYGISASNSVGDSDVVTSSALTVT
jgi:hypothetical protein